MNKMLYKLTNRERGLIIWFAIAAMLFVQTGQQFLIYTISNGSMGQLMLVIISFIAFLLYSKLFLKIHNED